MRAEKLPESAAIKLSSVVTDLHGVSGRIARRRGKPKAQVAVGNTQLKVYHKLLSSPGMRYEDLGPDYHERQASTRRQIAHHVGKLGALGFEATLCRIPEPGAHGSGSTQAA